MEKPKRARKRKLDTAKVNLKPLSVLLRRTGCPSRGGIRRVCGEVPGCNRGGDPGMNRSAKGGTRSSPRYWGEGVLIHPPHQGVCGLHGTEAQCVTSGGLTASPGSPGVSGPISESEVPSDARSVVGRLNSTLTACGESNSSQKKTDLP